MSPPEKNPLTLERLSDVETGYAGAAGVSRRVAWLRLLWSERRFLWKVTSWGTALAVLSAFLLPVRYESKARLMPPDQQSGSGLAMLAALAGRGMSSGSSSSGSSGVGGAIGGGLGSVAGDLLGLKSSAALFVDMLGGPTVQDQLIAKFDLRRRYHDKYWEDARKDLAKHTDVKEDRKSGVVTIAVSDRDPHRSQEMAVAYVDALNGLLAQVSTSSAKRERMFIEGRLKSVRQSLDAAMQQFSEYASKYGALDVPSQTKAMVESEATLEGQLVAAESQLDGLKQIYTDNNIRVRELEARVASLKRQVEAVSGNKADLNSSQSDIPGDLPSIRKLPLVGVRWADLYRETKIQETVYELLTQEYEFAKIQEAKEIPTVNVLDAPLVPERISFPPRMLLIVLGPFIALLLAGTAVIGKAAWEENQSAEKHLASEIWRELAAHDSVTTSRAALHRFWARVGGHNGRNGKAA